MQYSLNQRLCAITRLKSARRRANQRRKLKILNPHLLKPHQPVSCLPQNVRHKSDSHGWTLLVSQYDARLQLAPSIRLVTLTLGPHYFAS
jgi:hypothetical protein